MMTTHTVMVMGNCGFDVDYPADVYPFVVFVRCLANPLSSVWTFCLSKAQADAVRQECEEKIRGPLVPVTVPASVVINPGDLR